MCTPTRLERPDEKGIVYNPRLNLQDLTFLMEGFPLSNFNWKSCLLLRLFFDQQMYFSDSTNIKHQELILSFLLKKVRSLPEDCWLHHHALGTEKKSFQFILLKISN